MKSALIAITGGIGSGKSVVSRILSELGYSVYDTDRAAKRLMDESDAIKRSLAREIAREVICDGRIDRPKLSEIVFRDREKLACLNRIVHSSVLADLERWSGERDDEIRFVETALLYQSGMDRMVDEVWDVWASPETRVERVMKRNGLSRREVMDRIASQRYVPAQTHPCTCLIDNDGTQALLPQVMRLLDARCGDGC